MFNISAPVDLAATVVHACRSTPTMLLRMRKLGMYACVAQDDPEASYSLHQEEIIAVLPSFILGKLLFVFVSAATLS